MKRILVIDESEVVRETLALILGREFAVSKRSLGGQRFSLARLPLLTAGEIGCGQDRVALAMQRLQRTSGLQVPINAAEVSVEYLAQKNFQLSFQVGMTAAPMTLVIQNLDKSTPSTQALLLSFLQEAEEKSDEVRFLTTAQSDLLEKVYRGEFLEALYYKLATLTLKLLPLRERRDDIPILAAWFARNYAVTMGLGEPTLASEASSRLSNYLWFGNLSELETVIARTLTLHRKSRIEASDL